MNKNNNYYNIVVNSRKECLESLNYNKRNCSPESLLLGRCRSNAKTLRDNMEREGYDTTIKCGVLRSQAWKDTTDVTSVREALGNNEPIHFWVEVNGHICEVASECERFYGEPIANKVPPENLGYQTFEDSTEIEP